MTFPPKQPFTLPRPPRNLWRHAAFACTFAVAAIVTLGAAPAVAQSRAIAGQQAAPREVVRAYFRDVATARAIAHSRFETLESKYELGYVVVNANAAELRELRALGFRIEADPNWFTQQAEQARAESAQAKPALSITGPGANNVVTPNFAGIPGYTCYPRVEEVFSEVDRLIAARPDLGNWIDIGDSWEKTQGTGGYDLRVLKLTNAAVPGPKPKLFVNAGIHAREYTTTPLVLEFARRFVNGHGVDADLTWILDHHELHLLLVTNPDGRKQAEAGILWRKNTNRNYCGATSTSRGADLNRNFGFGWNSTNGSGSSGNACAETYRGPSGASEPETQAIEAYIRSLWPDRRGTARGDAAPADTSGIHLDIHSHGRLLLWPWGTAGTASANDAQLATLGRKFAYFNGHTPERSLGLYETDGTSDGPSYGELGVAAFTFELGTAFFEQCSYYNSTVLPGNLPALIYAAKVVRTPYATPAGPDTRDVAVSGNAATGVPPGTAVTLTATLDDTRYNNGNGTEPTQPVAAGEVYVDTPPWLAGATPLPMSAVDGTFSASTEAARLVLDTTGWSTGKHIVYVRGRDGAGNWGAFSAAYVTIDPLASSAPVAAFDASSSGLTASFTDRSTDNGTIVSRSWTFGDGSSSTATNPTRTYAASGSYTVTLTVTDDEGKTGSVSKPVTVADDGVPVLANGVAKTGLAANAKTWLYYKIAIPAGARNLVVTTSGGTGDADLYTQNGTKPTTSSYTCAKTSSSNSETCSFATPTPGWVYVGVYAYAKISGVTLKATFTP